MPKKKSQPPKKRRQCTEIAKSTGKRCLRRPILGGFVCVKHGGQLPRVKAKAAERLPDLIDPNRILS